MDESRFKAYISLIGSLLNCYAGEEANILGLHQDLVDTDLVQVMETMAFKMPEILPNHDQHDANYLLYIAAQISFSITPIECREFLENALNATWKNSGNLRAIHPILDRNLDKLNNKLARLIQDWSVCILPNLSQEDKENAAGTVSDFGKLIQEYPKGIPDQNLEIAIASFNAAQTILTRETYPEIWALIENNLGIVYGKKVYSTHGEINRSENIERAISHYENALQILKPDIHTADWSATQHNLANAYWKRIESSCSENLEKAIVCSENALCVRSYEKTPYQWANSYSNLALMYVDRIHGDRAENLEKAIACCEQSLKVFTRGKYPEEWARVQNNLGVIYRNRVNGDRAENLKLAISCIKNSLKIIKQEALPSTWALAQYNLALAHNERASGCRSNNIKLSIFHSQKALDVFTHQDFPEEWADIQMLLGVAYRTKNTESKSKVNLKKASACCQLALVVFTSTAFPEKWALAQANLGTIHHDSGEVSEAITCFQLALQVFAPVSSPVYCLKSGFNLGNTSINFGFWAEAIEGFSLAIEALETSRLWATSELRRLEIIEEYVEIYEGIVRACVYAEQQENALEYVERSRSKRLVDLIASNDLYQTDEISPEVKTLLEQFETLQQQIDQERNQHTASSHGERSPSSNSRAAFEAYSEAIAQLEAEKQTVWQALRKHDPVLAGQIQVEALTFEQIQNLIDRPITAVLSIFTTNTDTYIFVVRHNQLTLHTCPEQGLGTFQNWIAENWSKPYVKDTDQWKSQLPIVLENLAQRLQIRELIEQHLQDIEELIIVPHLFLHQIPFAALPIDDGEYLGDRFLIRHIPSCQILQFCQNRPAVPEPLIYGIVENATDDLPCAGFEGAQLSELFGISDEHRLKGSQQATVENFRQLAKAVNMLHCSHHATSRLDDPLHSELLLANGSITLGQLLTPGWRLPQLSDVFLSCCETHLGTPTTTDDILTLATGFLCAGARSVVSTLWLVDDLATALFAIFYYKQRQQGCDRPTAIRNAQVKLRDLSCDEFQEQYSSKLNLFLTEELNRCTDPQIKVKIHKALWRLEDVAKEDQPFAHPFYWAGFICQGLG